MDVFAFKPNILFVLIVFACEIHTSEVPRPRGVSLSRAPLYLPGTDFTCFDNSRKIPFTQVNDDYCDCADGSDEPGTSACPNGSFYCTNAGHRPLNLPSSRVNDGVCDCCDGSDEYGTSKPCSNVCLELGKSAREEAQRLSELVKAGKELKLQFSQKGIRLKQEKRDKLAELQKFKEEAARLKEEKAEILKQAQDLEQVALEKYRKIEEEERERKAKIEAEKSREEAVHDFQHYDANEDGVVDVAEIRQKDIFDRDNNGEVSEEEAKHFLANEEALNLDDFVEKAWPVIRLHKISTAGKLFKPPSVGNVEETEDLEDGEGPEEEEEEADHEEEEDQQEEPSTATTESDDDSTASPTLTYDEETQRLVAEADAARKESSEADKKFREIDSEVTGIQEYLDRDFGAEEEFAVLDGECFEYKDREYIYKLCPFKETVQVPVSGASEIRLGQWGKWSGPEHSPYDYMLYDRGQSCWNGPQRSATIKVSCGGENKVISVSEPNRCEYLFEFTTPAACRDLPTEHPDLHDEL